MDTTFTQGYALIVGVGGDLPNTVNDARGVASLFTEGIATMGVYAAINIRG
jgi:hypothetical protein